MRTKFENQELESQILIVQLESHFNQQKNAEIHTHKWQQSCVHLVKKGSLNSTEQLYTFMRKQLAMWAKSQLFPVTLQLVASVSNSSTFIYLSFFLCMFAQFTNQIQHVLSLFFLCYFIINTKNSGSRSLPHLLCMCGAKWNRTRQI